MKVNNRYGKRTRALLSFLIIFSLLLVTFGPLCTASADSDNSTLKAGAYYWTRGDPTLNAVKDDVNGFMDNIGFDVAFDMSDETDPGFPYLPVLSPFPSCSMEDKDKTDSGIGTDHLYLENADFVYFAGHAGEDKLSTDLFDWDINKKGGYTVEYGVKTYRFFRKYDFVYPGNCSWGDQGTTKWVALATCYGTCGPFKNAMNGMNLLLGWSTWCDDAKFGGPFATACNSKDNDEDADMTIRNAWFMTGMDLSTTRNLWMRVYGRDVSCAYDTIKDYQPNEGSGSSVQWDVPVNHFPKHLSGNVDGPVGHESGTYVDDTATANWADRFPIDSFSDVPDELSAKATALNYLYANRHVIHENDAWGVDYTANVEYQSQSGVPVAAHVYVIRDNGDGTYMKATLIIVNDNHIVYCDINGNAVYAEDQWPTGGDYELSISGPDTGLVGEELSFTANGIPDLNETIYDWTWDYVKWGLPEKDGSQTESHAYLLPGKKLMKLRVSGEKNGRIMEYRAFKDVSISDGGELEIIFRKGLFGGKPVPPYQVHEGEHFTVIIKSTGGLVPTLLNGASVTFDGKTEITNDIGRAFFKANDKGTFSVTAEFEGYDTASESITIHQGKPMDISFSKVGIGNKIRVGDEFWVKVKGKEGPAIPWTRLDGADVTFNGTTKTTGSFATGKVKFKADSAGTYVVTSVKDGYVTKSKSVTIFEEGDDTKLMTVDVWPAKILVGMDFRVSVKGQFDILPIKDASVTIEDISTGETQTGKTNGLGNVWFTAPNTEEIAVTVQKEGYAEDYQNIPIYQNDMTIHFKKGILRRDVPSAKVEVGEDFEVVVKGALGAPVPGATVIFDGQTNVTGSNILKILEYGRVTFKANNEGENLIVTATKEGYGEVSKGITIYGDGEGSSENVDINVDASMPLTIDLPNAKSPTNTFDTLPKSFGEDGYSLSVDSLGVYSIQQNGVTVQDGFESADAAANWLTTGYTGGSSSSGSGSSGSGSSSSNLDLNIADKTVNEGETLTLDLSSHVSNANGLDCSFNLASSSSGELSNSASSSSSNNNYASFAQSAQYTNNYYHYYAPQDADDDNEQETVTIQVVREDGETDTDSFTILTYDDENSNNPQGGGSSDTYQITSKSISNSNPLVGDSIKFSASASGPDGTYVFRFKFGDGNHKDETKSGKSGYVYHSYSSSGSYPAYVDLYVDGIKRDSDLMSTVHVSDASYSCLFSPEDIKEESKSDDELSINIDVSIEFDGSGSFIFEETSSTSNNDDASSALTSSSNDALSSNDKEDDSKDESSSLVDDSDDSSDFDDEDDDSSISGDDKIYPPIPDDKIEFSNLLFSPMGIPIFDDNTPAEIINNAGDDKTSITTGSTSPYPVSSEDGEEEDDLSKSIKYFWDFGDGTPLKQGLKPDHTYEISGTYSVDDLPLDSNDGSPLTSADSEEDEGTSSIDSDDLIKPPIIPNLGSFSLLNLIPDESGLVSTSKTEESKSSSESESSLTADNAGDEKVAETPDNSIVDTSGDSDGEIIDNADDASDEPDNGIVDNSNDVNDEEDDEEQGVANNDDEPDDGIVGDEADSDKEDDSEIEDQKDDLTDDLSTNDKEILDEDLSETVIIASGKLGFTYTVKLYMVYDPDDVIKDDAELSLEDILDMVIGEDTTEITINVPIGTEVKSSSDSISSDSDMSKDNIDTAKDGSDSSSLDKESDEILDKLDDSDLNEAVDGLFDEPENVNEIKDELRFLIF